MFPRSKLVQQFKLFSQKLVNATERDKRHIKDVAAISATGIFFYNYPKLMKFVAENHISMFYSRLTPEQRHEISTSPEKSKEYKDKCLDEYRTSMQPD